MAPRPLPGHVQAATVSVLPKADLAAEMHTPGPAVCPGNGCWLGFLLCELREAG